LENDLEKITIRKSNIPILPSKLFSNLTRLLLIDLPGNHIVTIRRGAFRDAGSVELLNLESNNLTELGENVFGGLTGLKILRLAKNEISMIDSRAFEVGYFNGFLTL